MITFQCDCGKRLRAQDDSAGRTTVCPGCGARLLIPAAQAIGAGEPPLQHTGPPQRQRPARDRSREEADYSEAESEQEVKSAKAVASFGLGLISILLPIFVGLPAIVLGALGLGEIGRSRGRLGGKGLAVTGIALGIVTTLLAPLVFIFVVLPLFKEGQPQSQAKTDSRVQIGDGVDAVTRVRDAAAKVQSQNNLKQIALAMHSYQDTYTRFPPPVVYGKDGQPLYSWRVLLLPYVEELQLYKQFNLAEPWDSPQNKQLLGRMPKVFTHPASRRQPTEGLTHYQLFVGSATEQPRPIFVDRPGQLVPFNLAGPPGLSEVSGSALRIGGITDGTSNTVLAVEAADPVPWTKPADIPYSAGRPIAKLGGLFAQGYNVALGDGSVRFIETGRVSEQTLRNAITANDNNPLGPDW